jgi:hypothetical protein
MHKPDGIHSSPSITACILSPFLRHYRIFPAASFLSIAHICSFAIFTGGVGGGFPPPP